MRTGTLLAVVMILGAALRLAALEKHSLWLDEGYSLQVAEVSTVQIVTGQAGDRHTPPLYYVILHFWTRLGRDEFWLRLPSAVLGLLAVPAIFLLGRQLINERVGCIAAALLAISPYHLYYSQEARMYSLLMLLVVGSSLCLWRGLRETGKRWWVGYICLSTLALYTHYYAGLVLLAQAIYGIGHWRRHPALMRPLLLSVGAIGVLYLPWVLVLAELVGSGGQSFRQYLWAMVPYTFFRFNAGYALFVTNFEVKARLGQALLEHWAEVGLVFAVCGTLTVVGARYAMGRREAGTFLLLWLMVPLGVALSISTLLPILSERYLIVSFPAYLLLLAIGLEALPRGGRALLGSALVFILGLGVVQYFGNSQFGKEQWREAARFVAQETRHGDVILMDPGFTRFIFRYYYDQAPQRAPVPIGEAPRWLANADGAEERRRIWLVSRGPSGESPSVKALASRFTKVTDHVFPFEEGIFVRLYELYPGSDQAGGMGRGASGV